MSNYCHPRGITTWPCVYPTLVHCNKQQKKKNFDVFSSYTSLYLFIYLFIYYGLQYTGSEGVLHHICNLCRE